MERSCTAKPEEACWLVMMLTQVVVVLTQVVVMVVEKAPEMSDLMLMVPKEGR